MTIQQDVDSFKGRWIVVGNLTTGVAMALTSIFVIGLLLPDMADELELSPVQQGWLGASVVFGNLFLAIPLNLWLSRYRPWRVAFITFLGIGGFTLLQAFAPNFAILIIGRVGLGISFIANQSPRALIIQQWSPPGKVQVTTGVVFGAIDIIMGTFFFLAPVLNNALGGWRPVLMVMGGVGLATAAAWTVLGRERDVGEYHTRLESQKENPLLSVLRYKQLWLMGFGMLAVSVGGSAIEHFWPTHAEEGLLVSNNVAGALFGLSLFGAGAAVYLFNVIPFFSRFRTLTLALSGFSTAAVNGGLLFITSPVFLLLLSVPRGVANLYFPLLMIMVYQLPGIRPREVAMGIAFMQTSIWLGNAFGPLIVGYVQEATDDLRLALLCIAFTGTLLAPIALVLHGLRGPSEETPAIK